MDTLSLEEEECSEMFLTQQYSQSSEKIEGEGAEGNLFCGVERFDFQSPCQPVCKDHTNSATYSDIFDEESDFQKPNFRSVINKYFGNRIGMLNLINFNNFTYK